MKVILIPPYQNPNIKWAPVLRELMDNYKRKGQLQGVEVDIDEGYFIDFTSAGRDEEVHDLAKVGGIKKIREYIEKGKYDAMVLTGGSDLGMVAGRAITKIPITGALHSALLVAALIGDRTGIICGRPEPSASHRHLADWYGLGHKLISCRYSTHSTAEIYGLYSKYGDNKEKRVKDPAVKKIIDDLTTTCIMAIEKDRVDSLILSNEGNHLFEEEIRQGLDKAGYEEIPLICEISAALEMAKAMVNMKLTQALRAYPSANVKAWPEYY